MRAWMAVGRVRATGMDGQRDVQRGQPGTDEQDALARIDTRNAGGSPGIAHVARRVQGSTCRSERIARRQIAEREHDLVRFEVTAVSQRDAEAVRGPRQGDRFAVHSM